MLGGLLIVKKIILLVFFSLVLFSCKNAEIVQNEDTEHLAIEKELSIWNLTEAESLLVNLNEEEKLRYTQVIQEKKAKLEKLSVLETILKGAFFSGDYTFLDKYMKLGTIDNFKYEKLKEYRISGVKLYIGNKNFLNDELNEIAVMNLYEESIYLEIILQYEGDDWFIKSFDEKR